VIKSTIKNVLCWDTKAGKPYINMGLFGYTKAFFCSTESQGSLTLHGHILLWVYGFPKTIQEYNTYTNSIKNQKSLIDYCRNIFRTSYPTTKSNQCPDCNSTNIQLIAMTKKCYAKSEYNGKAPLVLKCIDCSTSFSGCDLINKYTDKFIADNDIPQINIDKEISSFKSLPFEDTPSCIQKLVGFLLQFQTHSWRHVRSCFKKTKRFKQTGKICRFLKPHKLEKKTKFTPSRKIVLERSIGHEYLTTSVDLFTKVLKCNHDVKLLMAIEGPTKAYYTCKYATKDQLDIENPMALMLKAFQKAVSLTNTDLPNDSLELQKLGRKKINSLVNTLTHTQEIGAPMASLYFIRDEESPFYMSHTTKSLNIINAINYLQREGPILNTVQDISNSVFKAKQDIINYIHRPDSLESLHFAKFIQQYTTSSSGKLAIEIPGYFRFHDLKFY
jgi:hypothetical protein